ncbi:MAG TPA: hypothetical protein VHR66_25315 [Gemmataceae bacterium]|nr:hypothetical protein [Gemmataceae bacterium]
MRKRLLSVPISELKTVRLVCTNNGCEGVIEMPLANLKPSDERIRAGFAQLECPICGTDFRTGGAPPTDMLSTLTRVISELQKVTKSQVEFAIPDEDE